MSSAQLQLTTDLSGPLINTILAEQSFLRMLRLERKRSERSGGRFVLMLLENASVNQDRRSATFNKTMVALSRSTGASDITGWYRDGSVLAVVFTERGAGSVPVVDTLAAKMEEALRAALTLPEFDSTELSFYVFPDSCYGADSRRDAFSALYRDVIQQIDRKRISLVAKRCIDIAASLLLLVALWPLLLSIALAIKLTSRGPVLFRQSRLGHFGETFTFLKFRSMYVETDHAIHEEYAKRFISNQTDPDDVTDSRKVYKLKADPRITKVGGFLRRTSLDEFPQLFNVLSGRMSLVGPRPPLPYEFEAYEVWHRARLLMKPGITGIWQVEGRSRVKFDDMVRMDLRYAREWSLWLDIRILLRTPRAVLSGNGAY